MPENGGKKVALYMPYGSMYDKKYEADSFDALKRILGKFGSGHWVFEGDSCLLDQRLGPHDLKRLKGLVEAGKEVSAEN